MRNINHRLILHRTFAPEKHNLFSLLGLVRNSCFMHQAASDGPSATRLGRIRLAALFLIRTLHSLWQAPLTKILC